MDEKVDFAVFYALGTMLIVVGIIIIILAIVLAALGSAKKGKVKAAGVIMIGPVPIIFGTDKKSVKTVLALALALTVTLVFLFVIYYLLR